MPFIWKSKAKRGWKQYGPIRVNYTKGIVPIATSATMRNPFKPWERVTIWERAR